MLDLNSSKNDITSEGLSAGERFAPHALKPQPDPSSNVFFTQAVSNLSRQVKQSKWICSKAQRFEHAIPATDPLDWLQINTAESQYYWRNRKGTLAISGLDAASHLSLNNMTELRALFDQAKQQIAHLNCHFICSIGFNTNSMKGIWKNHPQAQLALPLVEVSQHYQNYKLAINLCANSVLAFDEQKNQALSYLRKLRFNKNSSEPNKYTILKRTDKPSREQWSAIVSKALQEIQSGALKKLVLARHVELNFAGNLTGPSLLGKWQEQNQNCFSFLLKNASNTFLGCSPERLFSRRGRELSTEALAGTVERGACLEEDFFNEQQLLRDPKLRHEHQLVVDFLQQGLKKIATRIQTEPEAVAFKLARVQHLYFPLQATLQKNVDDTRLLELFHPTPAICGVPPSHAMTLINQMEPSSRGLYAGVVGVISPKEADMCVSIRSALLQGSKLHCYSGVGIVEGSEEQQEWDELEAKISTLLDLFS